MRTCFFITPFGQPDSIVRTRADAIATFLSAILESRELRLVRGDSTAADGDVLRQVVTERMSRAARDEA